MLYRKLSWRTRSVVILDRRGMPGTCRHSLFFLLSAFSTFAKPFPLSGIEGDVIDLACGSAHSVVLTTQGKPPPPPSSLSLLEASHS